MKPIESHPRLTSSRVQKDRKNHDTSSRIKRWIITDWKTHTDTNTHSKQTALPAE